MDEIKVKNLLKKLATLKKRAGTEGEAQAAAAAIQRLLLKYNLSMSEVDLTAEEESGGPEILKDTFTFSDYYQSKTWKQQLLFDVAGYNFVRAILHGNNVGSFIGRPENVKAVRELFEYIIEQLERLSYDELWKAQGWVLVAGKWKRPNENTVRTHGKTWRQAFLLGAVHRIQERMSTDYWKIIDEERARNANKTKALITLNDKAIQNFMDETWKKIGTRNVDGFVGDWRGYDAGAAAGSQVNLGARPQNLPGGPKLLNGGT